MKKHTKEVKLAYLFDEIGKIDDHFVAEAIMPSVRQRSRRSPRRILLLAACLSLACLLVFSAVTVLSRRKNDGADHRPDQDAQYTWAMDELLTEHHQETASGTAPLTFTAQTYDFFAGETRLVWQYEGSDTLYASRALSNAEVQALLCAAQKAKPLDDGKGDQPVYRVWLAEADGDVWTPYLKSSPGNVSTAEFFDYCAEVVPSEEWISCVSDLIS